ncbi:MAG TPA: T9SS type A sorting domain-containing protein [Candidatus Kapabacteria bacterium]|nr:T9SS type A sorting domain-containing protein [Candidatus Kapabacteria bacterium]
MVYIGTTKVDSIAIVDTGKGNIIIQDVYTSDPYQTWILGAVTGAWQFPDTLHPGDTLWLLFTFAPSNGTGGGLRHYQVKYTVVNSTGDTVYATAGGTAVEVDMYTHIDTTYLCYLDSTVTVSMVVDSIIDPIGNDNVHGYVMEMSDYNRSIVALDKSYNLDVTKNPPSGTNFPGEDETTMSAGATVVDNIQDDTNSEVGHDFGDRGYYELVVNGATSQIENPVTGPLLKFRFKGIALGKSTLVYNIPYSVYDNKGDPLGYVVVHSSPGLITVIPPPQFGFSVYPNPFDQSAAIHFSINNPTHAKLTVYNSIGQSVGTVIDQDLSPGNFTANFAGAGLPNGIYFYTLTTTSNGTYRGRMELLR